MKCSRVFFEARVQQGYMIYHGTGIKSTAVVNDGSIILLWYLMHYYFDIPICISRFSVRRSVKDKALTRGIH